MTEPSVTDLTEIPSNKPTFVHVLLRGKNVGTRNNVLLFLDRENMSVEDYTYVTELYSSHGFLVVSRGIVTHKN